MNLEAVHIVVHGRVQGVCFRASTQSRATELGLKGWVRNRPEGTVEIHAEGEKKALESFVEWCRQGPPAARVDQLDANPAIPEAMPHFKVR